MPSVSINASLGLQKSPENGSIKPLYQGPLSVSAPVRGRGLMLVIQRDSFRHRLAKPPAVRSSLAMLQKCATLHLLAS